MQIDTLYDVLQELLEEKLEAAGFGHDKPVDRRDMKHWTSKQIRKIAEKLVADIETPKSYSELFD